MLYKSLLCTLLVSASTAYTMDKANDANFKERMVTLHRNYTSDLSDLNKTIYKLFLNNNITEAKKILPRKEEEITSLLVYSCKTNNSTFLEWILNTKKPLFDSVCVQETFDYAIFYSHDECTPIFDRYIEQEKNKLQQELDEYAETQIKNIAQLKNFCPIEQEKKKVQRELPIDPEKHKLQQKLDEYAKIERQKIEQYKAKLIKDSLKDTQTNDDQACRCIIS